jgi:predicted phosphodiesterase
MRNFENYFKKGEWVHPVRNSCRCDSKPSRASNPGGAVLGPNPASKQRSIISNGMKILLLSGVFLLFSFLSYAGPIREVTRSIQQVQSLVPPFQFAVIGDSRDGEKVYNQLLKGVTGRKAYFLIHLGDMVNHPGEKEWRSFFEISKQMDLPFFPVVGNHDVGTTNLGREIYRKEFSLPEGKTYYAFRAGGVLFVILDSEQGRGRIIKEQRSWLGDILSSSEEKFKLIFIHRPLFLPMDSLKTGNAMDRYPSDRDDLQRLFLRTNVKAVFAGHDHRYHRNEKEGILHVISGGGGAPILYFKEMGGFFHYVWLSVQKGKIVGEVVDLEGQIQDKFVIE